MLPVSLELTVPLSTTALVLIGCGISGAIVALIIAVVSLHNRVKQLDQFIGILRDSYEILREMTDDTEPETEGNYDEE